MLFPSLFFFFIDMFMSMICVSILMKKQHRKISVIYIMVNNTLSTELLYVVIFLVM